MIRSRKHVVACVRKPNKEIVTDIKQINPVSEKYKVLGLPFFRGIVNMAESLYLGMKSLMFSANNAFEIEGEEGKEPEKIEFGFLEIALLVAGVLGITAVFFLVPFLLSTWLKLTGFVFNLVEAVIRLAMFVGYLSVISLWSQYRRVLMYHGAEHKAINAHEAGVPMDVEHVKLHSRLASPMRNQLSFYSINNQHRPIHNNAKPWLRSQLSLPPASNPVIAGISYELLRLSGKYKDSPITKALIAPGLAFQRLTTKEPTDDMLEVSIKAVTEVNKLICAPIKDKILDLFIVQGLDFVPFQSWRCHPHLA